MEIKSSKEHFVLIAAVMQVIKECKFENVNGVPGRKKIINEFWCTSYLYAVASEWTITYMCNLSCLGDSGLNMSDTFFLSYIATK